MVTFYDMGGFYIHVKNAIALGDTVVKQKGQSAFLIKKRSYDLLVDCACDEVGPTDEYGYGPITTDSLTKSHAPKN